VPRGETNQLGVRPGAERGSANAFEPSPSGALHEVSNVLTVVMGWLDVAVGLCRDAAVKDALEVALSHARFGYRVARRSIGASTESDTSVRAAPVVLNEALKAVAPLAEKRSVKMHLEWNSPSDEADIESPDAALQILVNLLLNALAFTPEGGRVVMDGELDVNELIVRISDEGPGIEPKRAATLLSSPDSTRSGGAGIGLTHCASLARQHGGELRLVRCAPGATFELLWPRTGVKSPLRSSPSFAPPTYIPVREDSAASIVDALSVLLLEDDPAVCTLVEVAFAARGAEVLSAQSLDEVDRVADTRRVDAILVDLSPLHGAVEEGLERLRRRVPATPMILITGSAGGFPERLATHFAAWVRKPFEPAELLAAVRRVAHRD
jgi:CheY-like chemotaxis protein